MQNQSIISVTYQQTTLTILPFNGTVYFPIDEWLPQLKYRNIRETLRKIPQDQQKTFRLLNHSNPIKTIKYFHFIRMVQRNRIDTDKNFKSWIINKVFPDIETLLNQQNLTKIEKPQMPLSLYYAHTQEIASLHNVQADFSLSATQSAKHASWQPGTTILTMNPDHLQNALKAMEMGLIDPSLFMYFECLPDGRKRLYTFDPHGQPKTPTYT